MTKPEQTEPKVPLNTRIPKSLDKEVRKGAIDLGLTLEKFTAGAYTAILHIKDDLGLSETKDLAQVSQPLYLLHAARNRLAKIQTMKITIMERLDALIIEIESNLNE